MTFSKLNKESNRETLTLYSTPDLLKGVMSVQGQLIKTLVVTVRNSGTPSQRRRVRNEPQPTKRGTNRTKDSL